MGSLLNVGISVAVAVVVVVGIWFVIHFAAGFVEAWRLRRRGR